MTALVVISPEDLEALVERAVSRAISRIAQPMDDGWQTVADAAGAMGVDKSTINRWVRDGLWEAQGGGANRRVRRL